MSGFQFLALGLGFGVVGLLIWDGVRDKSHLPRVSKFDADFARMVETLENEKAAEERKRLKREAKARARGEMTEIDAERARRSSAYAEIQVALDAETAQMVERSLVQARQRRAEARRKREERQALRDADLLARHNLSYWGIKEVTIEITSDALEEPVKITERTTFSMLRVQINRVAKRIDGEEDSEPGSYRWTQVDETARVHWREAEEELRDGATGPLTFDIALHLAVMTVAMRAERGE